MNRWHITTPNRVVRLDGAHVLNPLKLTRIRAVLLAHAAAQLVEGFVLVFLQPLDEFVFQRLNVADAVAQEGGDEHGDVGSGHQHFDDVGGPVDAGGGGEAALQLVVQQGNPGQGQALSWEELRIRLG
jgi:hypothetical protein